MPRRCTRQRASWRDHCASSTRLRCTTPGWVALGDSVGQSAGLMFSGVCSLSTNESADPKTLGARVPHPMTAAPAFFRIADVMRITALSRATVYRRIADGIFPPPVHLGGRACGWTPAALQAWIDDPGGYRAPRTPDGDHADVMAASPRAGRAATDTPQRGGCQPSSSAASSRSPSLRQASRFSSA
jgi:prophage regulatory protein